MGAIVREMPRDLWSFVSVDSAVVLGIDGGAALLAHVWDDDLVSSIEVSPHAGHRWFRSAIFESF